MTFSKTQKLLSFSAITVTLLLSYTNCAGPMSSAVDPYDVASQSAEDKITLSPNGQSLNWGESMTFEATGGVEPYTYSIVSGGGTLNSYTGVYTAPSYDHTLVVQARDDYGQIAQATLYVAFSTSSTMVLSYSPTTIKIGTTVTLSASGGTAPYTYKIVSGVGSISGNTYYASAFGSATVGIIDSKGLQNTATLTVSSEVEVPSTVIYRWYSTATKRHYYVNSNTASTGWVSEGAAFKVATSSQLSTVTLLRCQISTSGVFFVSSSGSCSTYKTDGTLGYVYTYKISGSTELFACFNSKLNDYLATTSATECNSNGYAKYGTLGYVPQ